MSYENLYKEAKFRDAVNAAKKVIKSGPVGAGLDAMAGKVPGALAATGVNAVDGAVLGAGLGVGYTGAQALYQKVKNGEISKEEIKEQLKNNTVTGMGVGAGLGAASSLPGIVGQFRKQASEYNTGGYEDMYYNDEIAYYDMLEKVAAEKKQKAKMGARMKAGFGKAKDGVKAGAGRAGDFVKAHPGAFAAGGGGALGAGLGAGAVHMLNRDPERELTNKHYALGALGGGALGAGLGYGAQRFMGKTAEEIYLDAYYDSLEKIAAEKKQKAKMGARMKAGFGKAKDGVKAGAGRAGDFVKAHPGAFAAGGGGALGAGLGAGAVHMLNRDPERELTNKHYALGALGGGALGAGLGYGAQRFMGKTAEEIYEDAYFDALEKIAAEEEAIINDAIAAQEMAEAGIPAHIEDVAYNELYDDENYMDESAPIDEYMKEDLHPGEGNVPTPEEVEEEMEAVANYFDGLQGLRKEAAYYYGY